MFGIGFLFMFVVSFCESFNMKQISLEQNVKNFLTFVLAATGAIVSFTIFFSFQNTDLSEQTKIFEDYRFYMAVFSEIIGVWLARKNYEVNGTNMVAINFSLFFSLILVPIYAFFLNDLLGFEKTLTINYNSSNEFWLFIGLPSPFSLLTLLSLFRPTTTVLPLPLQNFKSSKCPL